MTDTATMTEVQSRVRHMPQRVVVGACLAFAGILIGTADGGAHLVRTWLSSPTYTHGFLVPAVTISLIASAWRRPEGFGWPTALAGCAMAAAFYVAGLLGDVRLLQHAGIAGLIICSAASVLGRETAIRHRFALLFLFAMIPFGEGLVPLLQEATARGIMMSTAILGVPALREGMLIATPAGDFEVAEACAGLRFVIASLITGVLCAHLFFTSKAKQAAVIVAAAIVPIIANVLRASGTVLIAEATNMQVAAGADHLFYGWVFFAVVTGAVVLIAYRKAEPDAPRLPTSTRAGRGGDPLFIGLAAAGFGLFCAVPGVFK